MSGRSWVKRVKNRVEMRQLREVFQELAGAAPETTWKQMRAILYSIRLLVGSQWRSKGNMRADFGTVQMKRAVLLILSRRT